MTGSGDYAIGCVPSAGNVDSPAWRCVSDPRPAEGLQQLFEIHPQLLHAVPQGVTADPERLGGCLDAAVTLADRALDQVPLE